MHGLHHLSTHMWTCQEGIRDSTDSQFKPSVILFTALATLHHLNSPHNRLSKTLVHHLITVGGATKLGWKQAHSQLVACPRASLPSADRSTPLRRGFTCHFQLKYNKSGQLFYKRL